MIIIVIVLLSVLLFSQNAMQQFIRSVLIKSLADAQARRLTVVTLWYYVKHSKYVDCLGVSFPLHNGVF